MVVFDALSRVSRDVSVYLEIKKMILAAGARFSSPSFQFDDSPEGEFRENIQVSVDQYQRQANAAQTKRRTKARLMDGYSCMRPPFGYRSDGKGKVIVPDENYAPIAKAALEGFACGHFQTQAEVRKFIEGHPVCIAKRRSCIGNSVVNEMLKNILCAGYFSYRV